MAAWSHGASTAEIAAHWHLTPGEVAALLTGTVLGTLETAPEVPVPRAVAAELARHLTW